MGKKDNPTYFANRPYYWLDSITFIDESEVESDVDSINFGHIYRKYTGSMKFSEFILNENDWIIMDMKYYRKQKLEKIKDV